jgi:hypothetical protein
LKAGVSNVDPSGGAMPPPRPAPVPRQRRWPAVAAACAAVMLTGLAALWQLLPGAEPGDAWRNRAAAAYQCWAAAGANAPEQQPVRIDLQGIEAGQVPDLSAAKLSLVHVSIAPAGQASGLFLGYRGIHGCRLGLWIGAADAAVGDQPMKIAVGTLDGYAWRVETTTYALMSGGMDPARLEKFAEAVSRITRQQQRLDDPARIALRETTAIGAPCAG